MKHILYTLIFLSFGQVMSQNNLIRNYSFENHSDDFPCISSATTDYKKLKSYWNQIDYWEIPDKYNGCWFNWDSPGSPDVMCSDYYVRSGNRGARAGGNEFIVQRFKNPLKANHIYYFEFYYFSSSDVSKKSIGAYISTEIPKQCDGTLFYQGHLNGNENHPSTFTSNYDHLDFQWTRASGYFTTDNNSNNEWITYGSFRQEDYTASTIIFDDLKIIDIGAKYCPSMWLFDNMDFNQGPETYQASNKIIIGKGADPEVVDGDVVVKSGSSLKLKAPDVIEMIPGFTVEEGAKYVAERASCESSPCELPTVKENFIVCNNNEVLNIYDQGNVKDNWIIGVMDKIVPNF